ncbi:hypothetical protein B566_EDAN002590 [Ephemera danica]|nr:hypothetical protein B566_EDAN002590 [Ephemera danica]
MPPVRGSDTTEKKIASSSCSLRIISRLVREARAGYTATVVEFAPTSSDPLQNIEEYKTIAQRANNSVRIDYLLRYHVRGACGDLTVQTQSLWSYAMNVNFLGSGFSDPSTGSGGSGLYEARSGVLVHATPWEASSLPLTATFKTTEHTLVPKVRNQKNKIEPPYYYQEDLTNYTTQLINLTVKNYELCHNEFCCHVELEATIHDTTVLRVIAFDGERTYGGGFYTNCKVQTCGVIRCQHSDEPVKNCGLIMNGIAQKFSLTYIKVWATFSNDAIIGPSIVNGELGILKGDQINFIQVKGENSSDYSLELVQPITENILTFALWGRGSQIIVFPEYGLTGTQISEDRDAARAVSHEVPAPGLQLVPCDEYHSGLGYEIVGQLSCIAKENEMYVVANLIEKLNCPNCSDDSLLLFNTNVVFDRAGVVVARFGLITCFDIMFEEPAVTLVREHEVTEVIFPTAWIHELPFLTDPTS